MPAPVKIDAEMRRAFVRAIRKGSTISKACELLGLTRWAVHLHRQSDAEFDKAVRTAALVLIDRIADVVAEKALAGDLRAAEFFLVNPSRQLGLDPKYRRGPTACDSPPPFPPHLGDGHAHETNTPGSGGGRRLARSKREGIHHHGHRAGMGFAARWRLSFGLGCAGMGDDEKPVNRVPAAGTGGD